MCIARVKMNQQGVMNTENELPQSIDQRDTLKYFIQYRLYRKAIIFPV